MILQFLELVFVDENVLIIKLVNDVLPRFLIVDLDKILKTYFSFEFTSMAVYKYCEADGHRQK